MMSITADREIYALESRCEMLESVCGGDFVRDGECDRIEAGTGGLIDEIYLEFHERLKVTGAVRMFTVRIPLLCDPSATGEASPGRVS